MTTTRYITFTTFLLLGFITVANWLMPTSLLSNFASAAPFYTALRIGAMAVLLLLMVTDPPRPKTARILFAVTSLLLACVTVYGALDYTLMVLDALLYIELTIIFALQALESDRVIPEKQFTNPDRRQHA